jgi:phosphate transport system substrate-binding protein
MIDKACHRFLDYSYFVARKQDPLRRVRIVPPVLLVTIGLGGCSPQSAPGKLEDTQTSGRIRIVCAPEAYTLITREQSVFRALYPQASIEVRAGTSRNAIADLFAARCDLAVVTRELEPEERRAAVLGKLELEGYRFARDALVVVTHPANPVENLAIEDVRRIYRGETTSWAEMGGTDVPIVPVLQPLNSDVTGFFVQQVMGGEPLEARVAYAASDSDVIARATHDRGAIGFVSLAWADRGAKVMRLASLTGLPYWKPDLEAVYKGEYPLTRYFTFYVRSTGPRLASGFITYVTSYDGQKLVHEDGLVPTAVPVRFVRRSPLMSSHR